MPNKKINTKKLWGTAFTEQPEKQAVLFAAGRDMVGLPPADEVLIPYELKASMAYVKGLFDQKLISYLEKSQLLGGLTEIEKLHQEGNFQIYSEYEDVHSQVEAWLTDKLGIDVAGKIHTGRSRNEQVIVNMILYLKDFNVNASASFIEIYTLQMKLWHQKIKSSK